MAKQKEELLQEKLAQLHNLLKKSVKEKNSSDVTIDSINKICEKVRSESRIGSQMKNKLQSLYTQAMNNAESEQECLKKVLDLIIEIREVKDSLSKYSAPTVVRRGVLMSMLQEAARILPLWVGEPGHESPPLCGSRPPDASYICQPGDKIAALVREDGEENWILAEVIKYQWVSARYQVADVDAEEGKERYSLHKTGVIPLPLWKANPETNPEAIFKKGEIVLALYPQTTCFYRALVDEPPTSVHEDYTLFFEDPSYPEGIAPSLAVPQRYVIRLQRDPDA